MGRRGFYRTRYAAGPRDGRRIPLSVAAPDIRFSYTRHQTARGARPDAARDDKLYLFKKVSEMRLTYQIRFLAYAAHSRGKTLIVRVPKKANVHPSLRDFLEGVEVGSYADFNFF